MHDVTDCMLQREDEDGLFARQLHARCSLVEALLSKAAEEVKSGQLLLNALMV